MRNAFASGLLAFALLAGASMLLSACNTAAGFGEDMQEAGHALTNKAEKVQGQPQPPPPPAPPPPAPR